LFNLYEHVNALDRDDYNRLDNQLADYVQGFHMEAFIYDAKKKIIYQSKEYPTDNNESIFQTLLLPKIDEVSDYNKVIDEEHFNSKISFVWTQNDILDIKSISLVGTLDNEDYIVLRARLIPSEVSIIAATRFAPLIGLIVLAIGMILAYVLSNTFTKPLIEMNKTTHEISNLNFDVHCRVQSKDEVGQLAQTINWLSEKLNATIGNLNNRNDELKNEIVEKEKIDSNRKQLLNNVSHELKTPLTLMQSYADGLKLNIARDHNKVDYYCDVIIDETEKMNDMINKLLDINRIASGDISFVYTKVDVNTFVRQILMRYEDLISRQNIHFELNEIKATQIIADKDKLETVICNLLDNAIKYVDENKSISVTLMDNASEIVIEVHNTASAVSQEKLDKLWDSFYKIDESRNRDIAGHGLGLSIVKTIQESDHLKYGATNFNNGLTFWIEVRKA